MSIILSGISFRFYQQQPLFNGLNLSVGTGRKISIIGNNGTGKSTLLKIMAGQLECTSGSITRTSVPYYLPQQIGLGGISIGMALGVEEKVEALHAIYAGGTAPELYDRLANDWDIESRCRAALDGWELPHLELIHPIDTLSGGEKTKLFLARMEIHRPDIVLLDEPTNHLDTPGRNRLYEFIRRSRGTLVVVSHDITLLNLLHETYELSPKGLKCYGGNFDFYKVRREVEEQALQQQIESEESALRLARMKAQEVRERQERRCRQGEKNKDQIPRILRKGLKDSGERTASKLNDKHAEIIRQNRETLAELRQQRGALCQLKVDIRHALLHTGKLLLSVRELNYAYPGREPLWSSPLTLQIHSGERIRLTGANGSGKTTLIKLITEELHPTHGVIKRNGLFSHTYLDQEYSLVKTPLTLLQLAQEYNRENLPEHELKTRLHRALFPKEKWDTPCRALSGGERMRLSLCCLMISNQVPDLFILDEPTNNLDLSSLEILTRSLRDYRGTLLIISHDTHFIGEIGLEREIALRG